MIDNITKELLTHLHRGGAWGNYWQAKEIPPIWYPSGKPCQPYKAGNVYFCVHPLKERLPGKARGGIEHIAALNCLYAEFDARSDVHTDSPWVDKDAILAHIAELDITPSVILDSGGGIQAYWLLDAPFVIGSKEDLARADSTQKRWVKLCQSDTGAKDLARVLRLPGTKNVKYDPPREAFLIPGLYDLEKTFTFELLESILPPEEQAERKPIKRIIGAGDGATVQDDNWELLPGSDFNARAKWADVLPAGWAQAGVRGDLEYWRRPGKKAGISATIGYKGADIFHCFTSSAPPLEAGTGYTKFGMYAVCHCDGDFTKAAKELYAAGYGKPKPKPQPEPPENFPSGSDLLSEPPQNFAQEDLLTDGQPQAATEPPAAGALSESPKPSGAQRAGVQAGDDQATGAQESPAQHTAERPKAALKNWQAFTLKDAYQERPPARYAVGKLFELPSVNIVYGAPGSMKSFFLADLAACIAGGRNWLTPLPGEAGAAIPVSQGPVLWLDFDNGQRRTHERFSAVGHGLNLPEDAPLYYFSMPSPWLDADNKAHIGELAELIKSYGALLVVVDNLGAITPTVDENSAEMIGVFGHLRWLAEYTGAGIVVIHHQRKSNGFNSRKGETMRGHSGIEAALDLALLVERGEEGRENLLITATKTRGIEVQPFGATFAYENRQDGELYSARFFGKRVDNQEALMMRNIRQAIMASLAGSEEVKKGELVTRTQAKLAKVGEKRIAENIDALVYQGQLKVRKAEKNAILISLAFPTDTEGSFYHQRTPEEEAQLQERLAFEAEERKRGVIYGDD